MSNFINQFPYSDFHELNLDWLIRTVKDLDSRYNTFFQYNTIKFADPIEWDITRQYPPFMIVFDTYNEASYISKQPVPKGINIDNGDFWSYIGPLMVDGEARTEIERMLHFMTNAYESGTTASADRSIGTYIINAGDLWKVIQAIYTGDTFRPGVNIEKISIESMINELIDSKRPVDTSLNTSSLNAVANKPVAEKLLLIDALINALDDSVDTLDSNVSDLSANLASEINAVNGRINTTNSNLNNEISARESADDSLSARIDSIIALPDGSTTADAELLDIRIGDDGKTYSSAGAAVRGQFAELKDVLNEVSYSAVNNYVDGSGTMTTSTTFKHAEILIRGGDTFIAYCSALTGCAVFSENRSGTYDVIQIGKESVMGNCRVYTFYAPRDMYLTYSFQDTAVNMAFVLSNHTVDFKYLLPRKYDYSTLDILAERSTLFVSDRYIPATSYIDSVMFRNEESYTDSIIYIFDASTKKCIYKKSVATVAGLNYVKIGFTAPVGCVIGTTNIKFRYTHKAATAIDNDLRFSYGFITNAGTSIFNVGDDGGYSTLVWPTEIVALPIQVMIQKNPQKAYDSSVKEIKPFFAFVDDDTTEHISNWDPIISATDIRLGFACLTGSIGTSGYASVSDLETLYEAGHEIYSHGYTEIDFNDETVSVDDIIETSYKSKDWLYAHGFNRGSDVIVYSGGIGVYKTHGRDKQRAANQFYKYGVNAWGGINSSPFDAMDILRVDAETVSIADLKSMVDFAITNNSLLVFMTHSFQSNTATLQAKMIELINYIKTNSGTILPLNECLNRLVV